MDKIAIFLPPHAAGFSLQHNDNRTVYEDVAQAVAHNPDYYSDDAFDSPEDKQKCIDTNELWTAHWYPDTPVGFVVVHASSIDVLNRMIEEAARG